MRRFDADPLLPHSPVWAVCSVDGSKLTDPLLTHCPEKPRFWPVSWTATRKAQTRKSGPGEHFCLKAGDRIRTDDVQLGKLAFYH